MRSVLLTLSLWLTVAAAVAGENWPQFRGPQGDGRSDAAGLASTWSESEHIRWKTAIHDRGWSSPVVWDDQIWLTTATADGHQMYAICVDRETGKILHDLKLFDVVQPEEIHALNSYASPSPAIEAGRVYIHFGSYGTACLDTRTGQVLWSRRDLPCRHYRGPGSSPILYEKLLIFNQDGYDFQYVVALDKTTGQTVWKTDRLTEFGTDDGDLKKAFSTPVVVRDAGRPQLISPGSMATMAYDPLTGKELWRLKYKGFSGTAQPAIRGGLAYLSTGFGRSELLAVRLDGQSDVTDSHVVWRSSRNVPSKPSPVLVDDLLYLVSDSGVAMCLDAETGDVAWSGRPGGNYSASPLAADGRIYFFNHEGLATVIRPGRKYDVIATNRLDEGCLASPAVAGKALFVRTNTHLYRIEE